MKIGALWKKESSKGLEYFGGILEIDGKKHNIAVFATKEKKSDKSPDYEIVLSKKKNTSEIPTSSEIPF